MESTEAAERPLPSLPLGGPPAEEETMATSVKPTRHFRIRKGTEGSLGFLDFEPYVSMPAFTIVGIIALVLSLINGNDPTYPLIIIGILSGAFVIAGFIVGAWR